MNKMAVKAAHRPPQLEIKMKKYSIHIAYPIAIGILLVIGANITINEILDPTYHIVGLGGYGIARYTPRAMIWYLVAYGWFKYFTTVYRVELNDKEYFHLKSITKTEVIKCSDVIAIKKCELFVNIYHTNGKASICKLIDGISDISSIFEGTCSQAVQAEEPPTPTKNKIIKIIFVILLIVYAVYIEVEQIRLYKQ